MFQKIKKKGTSFRTDKRGFSLVEILIAIGILVILMVPLAMNMISGSQINSKAKQTAASSDLATSIVEVMQTVDLSDILTDVNGYSADEYGTPLTYTLTETALKNFDIGNKSEMILREDGAFVPVTKQETVFQDHLVTSSINTRTTGDVVRAYFTGQKSGKYAFLLSEVETDEINVDIVATIVPEQTFSIVNITSMAQTEVIYAKQAQNMDQAVADEFKQANDAYIALKGNFETIESKTASWFLENMERTITVTIKQDTFSEATNILMEATYSVNTDCLRASDRTITKILGSFTTNSTSEFARGVYLYYYPLLDFNGTNTARDHFVINNRNELSTPVYLIAMSNVANTDWSSIAHYHPTLAVNELSNQVYTKIARTTVCSNIKNELWLKTLYPTGRELSVKTLGNLSDQQTLYNVKVQVYRHRDDSYDKDGVFKPRSKDLLIETEGSFIDTSEVLDIDSDKTTGLTTTPGIATAGKHSLVYNTKEQDGVYGTGVSWTGTTKATDAGKYTAKATPLDNYSWADGTRGTKVFTWTIERSPTAIVAPVNQTYQAKDLVGVSGEFVEYTGITKARNAGLYTAYATPKPNYAWEDGTYETKAVQWKIYTKELTIKWATGEGYDIWKYDGTTHIGSYEVIGILTGDACDVTVKNNSIKDVGYKIAEITGVSNKNYSLSDEEPTPEFPGRGKTHKLTVISTSAANVVLKDASELVYDGTVKDVVKASVGVRFSSIRTAKDVGTYTLVAHLMDGYTWEDDDPDDTKTFTWEITPRVAQLKWGEEPPPIYNGRAHKTTCIVTNVVDGDVVTVLLDNNSLTDAGSVTVTAVGLSNPNYTLPSTNLAHNLVVKRAPFATVATYNFNYDGYVHTGVVGQYIIKSGTISSSEVCAASDGSVAQHAATVKPMKNYAWSDGTYGEKPANWTIYPLEDAYYYTSNMTYSGSETTGVWGENIICSGDTQKVAVGTYTTYVTPKPNHAWKDNGTMETRTVTWNIISSSFIAPILTTTELTYNGQSQSPAIDVVSINAGYTLSGETSATSVGTYTITAKLVDKNGSTWADGSTADKTITWKILPKELEISFDPNNYNTWTYDKQPHYGAARIVSGLCEFDTCDLSYSGNVMTNCGSQTFTVSADNPNYTIPADKASGTMTINQKEIGLSWGTRTWEYDGNRHSTTCNATNLESGDTCTVELTGNSVGPNVGTATVTAKKVSNTNYKLPTVGCSKTLEITAAALDVPTQSGTLTYSGSAQSPAWSGYDTAKMTIGGETSKTDAGTYTATFTLKAGYKWSDDTTDSKNVSWTINKAVITVPTQSGTLTYSGSAQSPAWNGYNTTQMTIGGTQSATNAGTYTATFTPTANYKWGDGAVTAKNATWSIGKATGVITLSATSGSLTYPTAGTFTATSNFGTPTVSSADTSVATASISNGTVTVTPVAAGTATITVSLAGTDNYTAASATYTVTVQSGTLSVTANGYSGTYDGNPHSISVTCSGATITYSTDGTNYSTTNPTYTNAGTYTVYYKVEKAGYTTVTDSKTVFIDKAAGSITAPTANNGNYSSGGRYLVHVGSSTTGTVMYRIGTSGEWSAERPIGYKAGTYTVQYYCKGDANHYDTEIGSVTAYIYKLVVSYSTPNTLYNNGTTYNYTDYLKFNYQSVIGTLSGSETVQTDQGNYRVYLYLTDTTNYCWWDYTTENKTLWWSIVNYE